MQIKHLKEFYNVDTISQDKGWKRVHEAIGELTEDLCIDFTDINIIEPWQCTEFKHLIKEPHLYMKFVNTSATAASTSASATAASCATAAAWK